jgi:hypothetical protein
MAEKLPRVVIVGAGFGGLAAGGDRRPDARADYIRIVVADACGAGHQEAADRTLASLRFAGDAIITEAAQVCQVLGRRAPA